MPSAMSEQTFRTDNPYTGETAFEGEFASLETINDVMHRAQAAHLQWKQVPLSERVAMVEKFAQAFLAQKEVYAAEITATTGRPLSQTLGEINGMLDRARQMACIAEASLAPEILPAKEGFERYISREPVGVVLVLAAWNYPLLIAINATIASVLAGNAVVIKHSSRSPRGGEQLAEAFAAAGFPQDLVTSVHATHETTALMVQHPLAGYVSFTGSVAGGHAVYQAVAAQHFIDVGLELGGKDPAYVRADAPFDFAVENIVDGAFYNAGQSCCGVERVYVHETIYQRFVDAVVEQVKGYKLGDPTLEGTDMGPMAQPNAPAFLESQVLDAKSRGARILIGGTPTSDQGRGRFFAPTVVADATHEMAIATEESFGPVVALSKVSGDTQALELMNDSNLGLTASIWSANIDEAKILTKQVQAGTVFINRADFLDPLLAWTGWKDSGRGASLSKFGFLAVTKPQSHNYRIKW